MSLPTAFVSERGTFPYRFAEAFLALGPQSIGVTGENTLPDLIGRVWLLVLTSGRELHLYQRAADAPVWSRVTELLPPVFAEVQPAGRRRFSIAFDQSSRANVAYEESGSVYLTRWDPNTDAYIQNVTVAGVDPCVVFDATWAYYIPDSDVLLFYLSPDRTQLLCRVQRDNYLIEYTMYSYPVPVVLDRVTRLPYRYQALTSDAIGEPLEGFSGERVALRSQLYTVRETDAGPPGILTGPFDGEYKYVVIEIEHEDILDVGTVGPIEGIWRSVLVVVDQRQLPNIDERTAHGELSGPFSGAWTLVMIVVDQRQLPNIDERTVNYALSGPFEATWTLLGTLISTNQRGRGADESVTGTLSGPFGGEYAAA